jgi:tRNA-Thr(GGU) m(6)t(6)A37 methyltransferase TsaA
MRDPPVLAVLHGVGVVRSSLRSAAAAPKQGVEGAPDAWVEVHAFAREALDGVAEGHELILLTWLHEARRDVLRVHPRGDPHHALTGVFATRSPHRPNPIGLHRVTVRRVEGNRVRVGPLEAIDATPVIDIKPVLSGVGDALT